MNFALTIILVCLSIINDFKTRKIKNIIPFTFIIIGIIYSIITNPINIFYSFITSFVLFYTLYYIPRKVNIKEFMGAGDIKIYIAICFLMGWKFTLYTFIYSVFVGAVFLILLNFKRIKKILINVFFFFHFKGKWHITEKFENTNIFSPYILIGLLIHYFIKIEWINLPF